MKTILITGATGYLGSHLVREMLGRGYQVVALKRRSSSLRRIQWLVSAITLYDIEELDYSEPFRAHEPIDAVIHCATCYGRGGENPIEMLEANTLFPLRVLEAAVATGVPLFLNSDTSLDKFLNPYAVTKKQFMEWGQYYAQAGSVRFMNARLEHFYGPGDDAKKFTTHVINSCMNNVPELKLTAGEQQRDFIYIDDAVAAYMALLDHVDEIPGGYVELDIGSGEPLFIKAFVEAVHQLADSTTVLKFGAIPYRAGEMMFAQADLSLLHSIGWQPQYTLEQGLKKVIEGVKA